MITNKKPVDNPEYILEADPEAVRNAQVAFKEEQAANVKRRTHQSGISHGESCSSEEDDGCERDEILNQEANVKHMYNLKISSSSCAIEDIRGFVYGGLTSRFWMLRKHINCLTEDYLKRHALPFYYWQCLTLQLVNRDVYLVIKNERQMSLLLKLLVHLLKTIDGQTNSALPLIK